MVRAVVERLRGSHGTGGGRVAGQRHRPVVRINGGDQRGRDAGARHRATHKPTVGVGHLQNGRAVLRDGVRLGHGGGRRPG